MIFDGWKEQKCKSVKGGIDTIMVSYDNAASENRMTRQVFYADVRMTRNLFVAEWDKKLFLNGLEEARGLFRVEVYAFCVLDDRFRMLVGGLDVKNDRICFPFGTDVKEGVKTQESSEVLYPTNY